jgi:hypothetical protein
VVPGNGEHGRADAVQDCPGGLELLPPATIREVTGRDEDHRLDPGRELAERGDRLGRVPLSHVKIGDVENPGCHRRGRLYTRCEMNESPELFDDVYLGLRAGGAARKQRRGEPLSAEEKEALGRWQRLSLWRKFVAVGAFAIGTFGLGVTIGGLIFGRWRKARA